MAMALKPVAGAANTSPIVHSMNASSNKTRRRRTDTSMRRKDLDIGTPPLKRTPAGAQHWDGFQGKWLKPDGTEALTRAAKRKKKADEGTQ
jgi:hypothetical protein